MCCKGARPGARPSRGGRKRHERCQAAYSPSCSFSWRIRRVWTARGPPWGRALDVSTSTAYRYREGTVRRWKILDSGGGARATRWGRPSCQYDYRLRETDPIIQAARPVMEGLIGARPTSASGCHPVPPVQGIGVLCNPPGKRQQTASPDHLCPWCGNAAVPRRDVEGDSCPPAGQGFAAALPGKRIEESARGGWPDAS